LAPRSYTVQETNSNGFVISDIDCIGNSSFSETGDSVTVDLQSDDTMVCTFTNTDECPSDPNKTVPGTCGCGVADTDSDDDGTPDCNDQCINDPNKIAPGTCGCGIADTDLDDDGTPDCNDQCINDPNKVAPGTCGCGVADTDSDGDGTPDCNDQCINDPNKVAPGTCGCGVADTDSDGDGTPNCNDSCTLDPNKTEPGACGCGVADVDNDGDGALDCDEICINDPNKDQPGVCGCNIPDTDSDGDGTPDCNDQCINDPNKIAPGTCGCGNEEIEGCGNTPIDLLDIDTEFDEIETINGDMMSIPVTIRNLTTDINSVIQGRQIASGLEFIVEIPEGFEFEDLQSSVGTCDFDTRTCLIGDLAAGGVVTVVLDMIAPQEEGVYDVVFRVMTSDGQEFSSSIRVIVKEDAVVSDGDGGSSGCSIASSNTGKTELLGLLAPFMLLPLLVMLRRKNRRK